MGILFCAYATNMSGKLWILEFHCNDSTDNVVDKIIFPSSIFRTNSLETIVNS